MKRMSQDRPGKVMWRMIWGMRVFFTVTSIGSCFFLYEGSPSLFHGYVVSSAIGWRWHLGQALYATVIFVAAATWFARSVSGDDESKGSRIAIGKVV